MQAQVAESVGRGAFANTMRRAAELIAVGDARRLEIYNALRPYRSTKAELLAIAEELEMKYNAKISGGLVREAAAVYEAITSSIKERSTFSSKVISYHLF